MYVYECAFGVSHKADAIFDYQHALFEEKVYLRFLKKKNAFSIKKMS